MEAIQTTHDNGGTGSFGSNSYHLIWKQSKRHTTMEAQGPLGATHTTSHGSNPNDTRQWRHRVLWEQLIPPHMEATQTTHDNGGTGSFGCNSYHLIWKQPKRH